MTKTLTTVNEVRTQIDEGGNVLRSFGIEPNTRLVLSAAAQANNMVPDELCAVLEVQMRRAARRHAHHEHEHEVYA